MATTRNPTVMYVGKDTHSKIVINTSTPQKVLTIVVNGIPALALSAVEAQELLDLLATRSFTIEHLAREIKSYLYNHSTP